MALAIEQRFSKLEALVVLANDKKTDELTASYLCRLGSVLVCGNLERCMEILITERFSRFGDQIPSFFRSHFKRGTNYDCEEIKQLLHKFDRAWGDRFEAFIQSNGHVKEGVSSCYAIRNAVAHGGVQNLGPRILKQYFDVSFELVAELEQITRR